MDTTADLATDLDRLAEAVQEARVCVAALDQMDAARKREDLTYSPLRTLLEQAEKAADRLRTHLRSPEIEPCIPPYGPHLNPRDGGPL